MSAPSPNATDLLDAANRLERWCHPLDGAAMGSVARWLRAEADRLQTPITVAQIALDSPATPVSLSSP